MSNWLRQFFALLTQGFTARTQAIDSWPKKTSRGMKHARDT